MKVALVLFATIFTVIAVYRITTHSKSPSRLIEILAIYLIICIAVACSGSKKDSVEGQTTAKRESKEINVEVDNKLHHQHHYAFDDYNPYFNEGNGFPRQPFGSHQGGTSSSYEHECWDCYGLQRCPRCAGNGRIEPDFGTRVWSEGRTIQCSYCNGTGLCPTCKGSGKLYFY